MSHLVHFIAHRFVTLGKTKKKFKNFKTLQEYGKKCQILLSSKLRKGVMKMSYESIAKLVHECVKNPKSLLSLEHGLPSTELKTNEFKIIQNVFSKYEVSGDTLTIGIKPLGEWA
ncbi:MAG: hypothetical protein ACYDEJ_09795 [Desulfitobacteriaceae bacterium]